MSIKEIMDVVMEEIDIVGIGVTERQKKDSVAKIFNMICRYEKSMYDEVYQDGYQSGIDSVDYDQRIN